MNSSRSVAAAWLLSGRTTVGRSFRLHRPRGAFCHGGWCQQCKVKGPDGSVVLACNIVQTEGVALPRDWQPLRAVGKLAERWPPWFYEHHAIGPGPFRQIYLETMRRLSSAPRLSGSDVNAARAGTQETRCDTLVVGGGVSGLSASIALSESGRRVVLVEAGELGGSAGLRCRVDGALEAQIAMARVSASCMEATLCVGLYENSTKALCVGRSGNIVVTFQELVVATGAYDRLPTVVGNDLPGIVGMRAFERLAASASISSKTRIGVYGAAIEVTRAIQAAVLAKLKVEFAAGPGELPDADARRFAQAQLVGVRGKSAVQGVELASGTQLDCELLVVGFSQPSYELQAQNGAVMDLVGEPPIVWPAKTGHTRMLAVGGAAGWFDSSKQSERTRRLVTQWLVGDVVDDAVTVLTDGSRAVPPQDGAFLCLCEDVYVRDIKQAIADGYRDVELIKRHTGAGTGPCQGKLCHGALLSCCEKAGLDVRIPTPRPLIRPVSIAALAGAAPAVNNPSDGVKEQA